MPGPQHEPCGVWDVEADGDDDELLGCEMPCGEWQEGCG